MEPQSFNHSKWAREIVLLQKPDGSWGNFHTLSNPTKYNPITTEKALCRLKILGLTIEDKPIQKAMEYLEGCIGGEIEIPDRREKWRDWDIFKSLMFATWLKIFLPQNRAAIDIAKKWGGIIEKASIWSI